MKKILLFAILMVITSSIFSQTTKFWKITKKDGTSVSIKLSSIATEQIVDSIYNPLIDSLYTCLMSGPWYAVSVVKKLPSDTNWTTVILTGHFITDYDLYGQDITRNFHSDGRMDFEATYYLTPDGKYINQSNVQALIIKLTMTELEASYVLDGWQHDVIYSHIKLQ